MVRKQILVFCFGILFWGSLSDINLNNDGYNERAQVISSDLEYIGCDMCMRMVFEAIQQIERIRASNRNLEEIQVHNMLDRICDPSTMEGQWLNHLDFYSSLKGVDDSENGTVVGAWQRGYRESVAKENFLIIFEYHRQGLCEEECKTASESCRKLIEEEMLVDILPVVLWRGDIGNGALARTVCLDWTSRCRKPRKVLSKSRIDYEFQVKTFEDFRREDILNQLDNAGLAGRFIKNNDAFEHSDL